MMGDKIPSARFLKRINFWTIVLHRVFLITRLAFNSKPITTQNGLCNGLAGKVEVHIVLGWDCHTIPCCRTEAPVTQNRYDAFVNAMSKSL